VEVAEYIVVGSGCSGATAAQTLVDVGASVTMVDVGFDDPDRGASIPARDYLDIRREEQDQHRYLIGDDAEGVAWGRVGKGEHITPPRRHILRAVDRLLPIASDAFSPFESLGYGGLGIGWGLGCWQYSRAELRLAGLDPAAIEPAYREVSARIGISAQADDAAAYALGTLDNYQPATPMDRNHELLMRRYRARREQLRRAGFVMGRAPLALLTRDLGERGRHAYRDMDFYADHDHSAWRPWIVIDALRRRRGFRYRGGLLVTRFEERDEHVELTCMDVAGGEPVTIRGRRVVLATSALGTARVVLRSLAPRGVRLPLLCNSYAYVPCLQPSLVGRAAEPHKLGFSQLSLFLDERGDHRDVAMASIYSYQSLMLFRIVRQAPLNLRDARIIMRHLVSGFLIMGLHQPDRGNDGKHLGLVADRRSPTGDRLDVAYAIDPAAARTERLRRAKYVNAMRRMGAYPLRIVEPGAGSSIHYAGTVPFSRETAPCRLAASGRLHGTRSVYVADSSGFRFLPAKGLTFTLMANAHVTALNALRGTDHY
jgi:hypothetical protein